VAHQPEADGVLCSRAGWACETGQHLISLLGVLLILGPCASPLSLTADLCCSFLVYGRDFPLPFHVSLIVSLRSAPPFVCPMSHMFSLRPNLSSLVHRTTFLMLEGAFQFFFSFGYDSEKNHTGASSDVMTLARLHSCCFLCTVPHGFPTMIFFFC